MRPKFVETFLDKLVNWGFAESNFAESFFRQKPFLPKKNRLAGGFFIVCQLQLGVMGGL
jgi:hypothetical protein